MTTRREATFIADVRPMKPALATRIVLVEDLEATQPAEALGRARFMHREAMVTMNATSSMESLGDQVFRTILRVGVCTCTLIGQFGDPVAADWSTGFV